MLGLAAPIKESFEQGESAWESVGVVDCAALASAPVFRPPILTFGPQLIHTDQGEHMQVN